MSCSTVVAAVLKKFREQYVDGLVSRKKDLMSNLNEVLLYVSVNVYKIIN